MARMTSQFVQLMRDALGGNLSADEAWIDSHANLTPRERRLRTTAEIARWTALLNGALGVLLLLVLLLGGRELAATVRDLALPNFPTLTGGTLLVAVLLIFANMTAALMLTVGALAQELWGVLLAWTLAAVNIALALSWGFWLGLLTAALSAWVGVNMVLLWRSYRANPVMLKELRGRMRGVRAFAIISVYLLLMSGFTVLLYLLQQPVFANAGTQNPGELGQLLFFGVVGVQLVLVVFIVPALTAGAVTGERERLTYDLLQTTLLPAPAFLVGKMESALGYILLLLLAAIPLQSIAFLFGGVSETELLIAFIVLAVTAVTLGAAGLFFSARTDRTLTATVRVYTVSLAILIGLPLLSAIFFQDAFGSALRNVAANTTLTPLAEAALIYADMIAASLNPVTTALQTQQMLADHQSIGLINVTLASDGSLIPVVSPWITLTMIYLSLTAGLILLAVRRMRRAGI